jgi:Contractile injection system tape measure protein
VKQNHIIHKVIVEVLVNNKKKAYEIKDNISSLLTISIFPQLEKYFNNVQGIAPGHTLQVSQLTVNLKESKPSLNDDLVNSIIALFETEFADIVKPALHNDSSNKYIEKDLKITLIEEQDKLLYTFIHFLEKGFMPWWNSDEKLVAIFKPLQFKKIVSTKAFAAKITHCLRNPRVRERIINQFTDTQIKQIVTAVTNASGFKIVLDNNIIKRYPADRKAIWNFILNVANKSFSDTGQNLEEYIIRQAIKTTASLKNTKSKKDEKQVWKELMGIFRIENGTDELVKYISIENNTLNVNTGTENKKGELPKAGIQHPIEDKNIFVNNIADDADDHATDDAYYVQNAGLVLIHPFINNLFKRCGLTDPDTKKLPNPDVCIHLLHYIATGKTNQPESNMLFEKFLCGVSLQHSISRHIKLTKKQKTEADKVINSVQENWSSMKTASVGLLQNEFFQRPGKLALKKDSTLTIEQKTQDILLKKLSWGISFVKLPWQDQFIYVNWQ